MNEQQTDTPVKVKEEKKESEEKKPLSQTFKKGVTDKQICNTIRTEPFNEDMKKKRKNNNML